MQPSLPFPWLRLLWVASCMLFGATGVHHNLSAQTFQYLYGDPTCRSTGVEALYVHIPGGGYLAVGEAYSGVGCSNSNVYVVRTNSDGSLLWSYTYDFQGKDSATNVIRCANGDYVIAGVTTGSSPSLNIFLLRISSTGTLLFSNVFDLGPFDDMACDVIETRTGDGRFFNIGELVVAGWTGKKGSRDALIFRASATLQLITTTIAAGLNPGVNGDDYFYAIQEILVNAPNPGAADLIAVGGTSSAGAGGTDVYIARTDPFGGPYATAVIGGVHDDEGRSVEEQWDFPNYYGDFLIAGSTRNGPGSEGATLDAYVVQVNSTLNTIRGQLLFGHATRDDAALSARRDYYTRADSFALIATGYTSLEGGTLTRENVFLQRITGGCASLLSMGKIYGGSGDERGCSVMMNGPFVASFPPPPDPPLESIGYIVAGYTTSPELTANQRLYLIKTDSSLRSGCNEEDALFIAMNPGFGRVAGYPNMMSYYRPLIGGTTRTAVPWETELCSELPGGGERAIRGGDGDEHDGVAGIDVRQQGPEAGAAASYPNPLRSGDQLNLRFDLSEPSIATIRVNDMLGRTVAQYRKSYDAGGSVLTTIPTEGWASGIYLVEIIAGGRRTESKVVVADR